MVRLFCLEALVMAAIGVALGLVLAQQLAHYALEQRAVHRQPPVPAQRASLCQP